MGKLQEMFASMTSLCQSVSDHSNIFLNQLIPFHLNNEINPHTLCHVYRQHGDRIMTTDYYDITAALKHRKGDELPCNGPYSLCKFFFFFLIGMSG